MQKKLILLILCCYVILMGTAFFRPLVIQSIMDKGLLLEDFQIVIVFSIVLFGLVLTEEAISIFQAKLFIELKNKVVMNLYTKGFRQLLKAKLDYYAQNNTTGIMNRLSTDINNISSLFDSGMMYILSYILKIICGIIGLVIVNWKLAILVLLAVPIKYMMICFFSKKKETGIQLWLSENAKFSAWFDDNINGIQEIKLWNLYNNKQDLLKSKQHKILELEKNNTLLDEYNLASDSLLQGIILSILYGVGGYYVCRDNLSIGSLTAFISYSNYVINPISLVMNMKLVLAEVKPSAERLKNLFVIETENYSKKGDRIKQFQDSIRFENVHFSYDNKPLLKNINLNIQKGQKIAIIGENGSGKSTLIGLLLRFLIPDDGNVFIDGKKIENYQIQD